jgi:hypothetical protein
MGNPDAAALHVRPPTRARAAYTCPGATVLSRSTRTASTRNRAVQRATSAIEWLDRTARPTPALSPVPVDTGPVSVTLGSRLGTTRHGPSALHARVRTALVRFLLVNRTLDLDTLVRSTPPVSLLSRPRSNRQWRSSPTTWLSMLTAQSLQAERNWPAIAPPSTSAPTSTPHTRSPAVRRVGT